MDHIIQLEKYNGLITRFTCPSFEKAKKFTRYKNLQTNEYISPIVGRCERVDSCGYHYKPRQFFIDNNIKLKHDENYKNFRAKKKAIIEPSYIHLNMVSSTLEGMKETDLAKFLYSVFEYEKVNAVLSQYVVGCYRKWNTKNPIYYQFDVLGNCRTGKIIKYNPRTGKRIKEPYNHIYWIHSTIKDGPKYNLNQCLYGEHLLIKNRNKVVGIVESEKTALIASIAFPKLVWLATGGKSNMKAEKFKVLKDRKVCLFPDANAYEDWDKKADEYSSFITDITISDLVESNCSEKDKNDGLDLVDFVLKEFRIK